MAAKLYVGGLPYSTTEDSLKQAFSQAGTVASATIVMDKFTGRSRGFAFVEMASDAEAQSAISMFHGKDFEGRTLTVNEARPMEPRGNRPPGGGYGGGGRGSYGGGGRGDRGGGHHGGRGDRGGRFDDRGGRDW